MTAFNRQSVFGQSTFPQFDELHRNAFGHSPGSMKMGLERRRFRVSAFTLTELLVVIGIMVVILVLGVPALTAIGKNQQTTLAAYEIKEALEEARSYAIANGTYVYVGLAEVDARIPASTVPQVAASSAAGGRVAIALVASKDGTKHFADRLVGQGSDWIGNYSNPSSIAYCGAHLLPVGKLRVLEGVHLASSLPMGTQGDGMDRPLVDSASNIVGNSGFISSISFTWPLGSSLSSGFQYRFDKVIQFDPVGAARIIRSDNGNGIPRWIEIALLQSRGGLIPSSPTAAVGPQAALQINGVTGAASLYLP